MSRNRWHLEPPNIERAWSEIVTFAPLPPGRIEAVLTSHDREGALAALAGAVDAAFRYARALNALRRACEEAGP